MMDTKKRVCANCGHKAKTSFNCRCRSGCDHEDKWIPIKDKPTPKPETDGDAVNIKAALEHGEKVYGNLVDVISGARGLHDLFVEALEDLADLPASHGQGEIVDALREALECTAARIENELSRVEPDRNSLAWIATEARDAAALGTEANHG